MSGKRLVLKKYLSSLGFRRLWRGICLARINSERENKKLINHIRRSDRISHTLTP